ncbi:restriction endonuclease subunit S [Endozoicomonas sp. SESOKO1]|uniref:restriction endonuclease subunit S n=1 Tax=Endozoicomonas sp. SESOKO1 TaxID=2828742 RepID=UPI00214907CD|nr:restriction endonuclease subunit S [Endozoicomonas sp. SESOKO1]
MSTAAPDGYKASPVGIIPADWSISKLKEATDLITCGLASTPRYVTSGGVPFLSAQNVKNGTLRLEKYKCISYSDHAKLYANNPPKRGDILYTRVGSIGEAAIIETDLEFSIYVSLTLIKTGARLHNEFLKQLLNSAHYKRLANNEVYVGGGVGNLNVNVVRGWHVAVPPLPEQKKIARILSSVDSKLALIDQQITTTQTLKKGLMQKLFTQGVGTQDADGRWQPHTDFQKTELGRIPVVWEVATIGSISENFDNLRVPIKSEDRQNRQGEYPYYGAQGIIDFVDDYIFEGDYLLVAEDGENVKSRKYDIALYVSGKFWVNNHAHILQSTESSDLRFLQYMINFISIKDYVTGQAQPKLNKAALMGIKIKLPPISEQKEISSTLYTVDRKLDHLQTQKAQTQQLKKGLMQKLLTGQIRVQPDPQDH